MTRKTPLMLLAAGLAFLAGCSSSDNERIQTDPTLHTVTRDDLEDGDIRLPANYNEENYRRLVMAVNFQMPEGGQGISPDIAEKISTRLQTEMAKLKRFTIYSLHNRGGVRVLQNLSDRGEANIEVPKGEELPRLDLIMTGAVLLSRERHERMDKEELIYEVEADFSVEELDTRTVKFAETAKGRSVRSSYVDVSGKRLGGFDEEDELQAFNEAAMEALAVLANKLGNTFPVGGQVSGVLGERMTLNRGFEHGIARNMQMVVYTRVSGVDLPVALAEANPGSQTSNLVVYRWNSADRYARPVINQIRKNPEWIRDNELWAVSAGMAIPPEWEAAFRN